VIEQLEMQGLDSSSLSASPSFATDFVSHRKNNYISYFKRKKPSKQTTKSVLDFYFL